jgi:hypothetical protein
MTDFETGTIIGAAIVGMGTGTAPLILNVSRGKLGWGIASFLLCLLAGVIGGLLLAIPVAAAATVACILTPRKSSSPSATSYYPRDKYGSIIRAKNLSYMEPISEPDEGFQNANKETEGCKNCGRIIGKLETPYVWRDAMVCGPCYKILNT